MEKWTRFLLYGTYDGFSCSTDGDNNIIMILDNGERVEMPEYLTRNASDFVEKNKIKLKDVIARIEKFDLATKAVWINEILYKLGSDYGLHKYYAGYKQGKFDGAMERGKVTIPQFVADWIEEGKKHCKDVSDLFDFDFTNEEVGNWFLQEKPFDLVARAWLDGYTVEKEPKYTVKVKGNLGQYLGKYYLNNVELTPQFIRVKNSEPSIFTKEELEQTGFGWVFDCEGIEVVEVE